MPVNAYLQKTSASQIKTYKMEESLPKILSIEEMLKVEGGLSNTSCSGLSFACGAGIALSFFTGVIGAVLWGPSTAGLCAGAVVACN